jgi:hypothetical protein
MDAPGTKLGTYLKAFLNDWLSGMCGSLSVPFAAIAVWAHAPSAKALWAGLAVLAFFLASYRVWRNERNSGTKEIENLQKGASAERKALEEEITALKRKSYQEELGRQGASILSRLSPEGKTLLRHLLTHEPIEVGARFKNEINSNVQDQQMHIACDAGIVRRNEVRNGLGNILRTEYVVNPRFGPVLQDLLYNG